MMVEEFPELQKHMNPNLKVMILGRYMVNNQALQGQSRIKKNEFTSWHTAELWNTKDKEKTLKTIRKKQTVYNGVKTRLIEQTSQQKWGWRARETQQQRKWEGVFAQNSAQENYCSWGSIIDFFRQNLSLPQRSWLKNYCKFWIVWIKERDND